MSNAPAPRKRRYFGYRDGEKRYLLTDEGDIYILNGWAKIAILEEFPKKGAFLWNVIGQRLLRKGVAVSEKTLSMHARHLINAGLLGVLVPEWTNTPQLSRDKVYRTALGCRIVDTKEVKKLLGGKTRTWTCNR